jgi:peroxisomal enoyl-CoA hydratase 2
VGKGIGFGGVILHGLCSYGHAARAVILNAAKGDGRRLQFMSARFTSPVLPGDELETSGWISTDEKTGGTRVDFVQKNKRTGKFALGGGVALLKGGQSKL